MNLNQSHLSTPPSTPNQMKSGGTDPGNWTHPQQAPHLAYKVDTPSSTSPLSPSHIQGSHNGESIQQTTESHVYPQQDTGWQTQQDTGWQPRIFDTWPSRPRSMSTNDLSLVWSQSGNQGYGTLPIGWEKTHTGEHDSLKRGKGKERLGGIQEDKVTAKDWERIQDTLGSTDDKSQASGWPSKPQHASVDWAAVVQERQKWASSIAETQKDPFAWKPKDGLAPVNEGHKELG
jgi:hypothetical protein